MKLPNVLSLRSEVRGQWQGSMQRCYILSPWQPEGLLSVERVEKRNKSQTRSDAGTLPVTHFSIRRHSLILCRTVNTEVLLWLSSHLPTSDLPLHAVKHLTAECLNPCNVRNKTKIKAVMVVVSTWWSFVHELLMESKVAVMPVKSSIWFHVPKCVCVWFISFYQQILIMKTKPRKISDILQMRVLTMELFIKIMSLHDVIYLSYIMINQRTQRKWWCTVLERSCSIVYCSYSLPQPVDEWSLRHLQLVSNGPGW